MHSMDDPHSPEDANILPPIIFDQAMTFAAEPLRAAFAYWDTARNGRLMPRRLELRLKDMGAFIDALGLVETKLDRNGLAVYFVSFAGTGIEAIFGERTGRSLSDGVPEEIAARWRLGFDMVQRSAKPIKARAHVAYEGKTEVEAEILVAPLGEEGTPNGFFVAIAKL